MTHTPAPGAPVVPDDVVARFRAAAPVLTADAAGLVTLGRRRRHVRRLAAGALAAVVVAGAAGAAVGMLRGPATPPADGDLAPSPVEVLGSRAGLPAGVPMTFAGPVGVLVAPDGRLHVWTSGSSSCPTLPRTVAMAEGVVVVEVGADPADGPECTADLVVTTTVVAPPPVAPLSPPPPVEIRDAESGTVLATSSDVPEGLAPVTVLEVRDGWPEGEEPGDEDYLRHGTTDAVPRMPWVRPGTVAVWTTGTTDCPAVPVAQLVAPEGFITYSTLAFDDPTCTGAPVLATWLLAAPEGFDPRQTGFGAGPLSMWVPGEGWTGGTEAPVPSPPARCPDGDAACLLDAWLVLLLDTASEPAVLGGQPDSPYAARAVEMSTSGSDLERTVGVLVTALDGPDLGFEFDVVSEWSTDVVSVEEGLTPDGQAAAQFTCGGFRFLVRGNGATEAVRASTTHLAQRVAGAITSCPTDVPELASWVADRTLPVG